MHRNVQAESGQSSLSDVTGGMPAQARVDLVTWNVLLTSKVVI